MINPDQGSFSALHTRFGWVIGFGALVMLAGALALYHQYAATLISVDFVGVMMLLAGIVEVIVAAAATTWGRRLTWILLGVLSAFAGLTTLRNPLLASQTLTLLLAGFLLAAGVTRLILAFNMRGHGPWGSVLVSALLTLLVGAMVLARWPSSSLYVLGMFLGIDLLIAGSAWLFAGLALRKMAAG